ncbi:peptidyl prolyl cis-trans isomerase [Niveomyces insectorum RCEF 264]|uniref:Peptidyl prolyl cis-trans isomerase n=1 Tax=Niveomyces insectorum RCEF 264 TaxID=1081102 RepID=A0A162MH18_9HYPO|nr:peptidyl prolyl cis-trans isomerase [Niveomyces insectorum RCEF 264]
MTDSARWKATVYVGGLGPQVTVDSLHDAFLPFGDIADVTLPKNERRSNAAGAAGDGITNGGLLQNGAAAAAAAEDTQADSHANSSGHRGFGYVEYEDADDAKEAIDNMDKAEFFGRIIKVTAAKAPKSANEGLGSRTALWNQESWLEKNAVSEEDRLVTEQSLEGAAEPPADPMQGLEGLDVAGPRPQ